jgi:hypothetical protein
MKGDVYRPDPQPRRPWRFAIPLALVAVVALAWTGVWYYAASRAESEITAWRAREAAEGRSIDCAPQTIGGYPFRIELNCGDPALELRSARLSIKAKELHGAVQIYEPSLLIAESTGPLTVADQGQPPRVTVDWKLAQASLRGSPSEPERISVVFDNPSATGLIDGSTGHVAKAEHLELHARQAPRLPQDPLAIDLALSLAKAVLPGIPHLPDQPIDAAITGTLRGLKDLAPRPLAQLLRELQAANGRLDITSLRIQQGEILTTGQGALGLTPSGRLDGQITLTVAGVDRLMAILGLDKVVGQASQNALDRLAPGLNLDRLLGPRGNAGLAAAGVAMLGRPAELEGRQAVALPLRFADGAVFLGPLRVGDTPALF